MIEYVTGDILERKYDAWVAIPVNTVGVPGKGLAKAWADRYPMSACAYRGDARADRFMPGEAHPIQSVEGRFILAFTKAHWRDPSRIEWIENILKDIVYWLAIKLPQTEPPFTVALPPLGCGLGGLPWPEVEALIHLHLGDTAPASVTRHRILVYPPQQEAR